VRFYPVIGALAAIACGATEQSHRAIDTTPHASARVPPVVPPVTECRIRTAAVSGDTVHLNRGERRPFDGEAITEDGELVAMSLQGGIHIWDARTCALTRTIPTTAHILPPRITFIAATHDLLAFDEEEQQSLVRIAADGRTRSARLEDVRWITARAISRDGKTLVAGGEVRFPQQGDRLLVFDLSAMTEARRMSLAAPSDGIHTVTFAPDQKTVIVTTRKVEANGEYANKTDVNEIDVATWTVARRYQIETPTSFFKAFAFGNDAFVIEDQVVQRSTGKTVRSFTLNARYIADDGRFVILSRDHDYFVWNLDEPLPSAPRFGKIRDLVAGAADGTILSCTRDACDVVPMGPAMSIP
jgi:hypothetical protein